MTTVNGARTQSWLDSLSDDEKAATDRVLEMPPGMAVAWLAVQQHRHEHTIRWWVPFAGASGGGGVLVVALRLLEQWL